MNGEMIGHVLKQRYLIRNHVASGGMSVIYRAFDRETNSDVAIKVLKPEYYANTEYVEHFRKEIKAISRLNHQNIVRELDSGADDGMLYFVMQYVPGKTLKELIDEEGAQPIDFCVRVAQRICSALNHAHARGVIHRDIKPQNILIDANGTPMLTDFGIAHIDVAKAETENERNVLGSVNYFSPEQARNERIDKRSDIYSLGVVFYEMTTGRLPFYGENPLEIALKHVHQQPEPPITYRPDMPESLNRIILKAMAKERGARYHSALDMLRDLNRCLSEPDGAYVHIELAAAEPPTDAESAGERGVHAFFTAQRRFSLRTVILLAGIIIATLLVTGFIILGENTEKTAYIPSVVGTSESSARAALSALEFEVTVIYTETDEVEPGMVISVDPVEGSAMARRSRVTLTVREGNSDNEMADVRGMTLDEALTALSNVARDKVAVTYEYNATGVNGMVVAQDPEAGGIVGENATITLSLNNVPSGEHFLTPTLTNIKTETAVARALKLGYKPVLLYPEERGSNAGITAAQLPVAGVEDERGGALSLWTITDKVPNYKGTFSLSEGDIEAGTYLRLTAGSVSMPGAEIVLYESLVEDVSAFIANTPTVELKLYIESDRAIEQVMVYGYHNDLVAVADVVSFERIVEGDKAD